MRRTPSQTDTRDAALLTEGGAVESTAFDRAFTTLVGARERYDGLTGDPTRVPELARASRALAEARAAMAATIAI